MHWRESKNIIVFLYNPYSCGKFVSNILSYNQRFVPQFPFDGNRQKCYSKETYDAMPLEQLMAIKHETIIKTIPSTKQDCVDWWEYELGCRGFWGFDDTDLPNANINPKVKWLLAQNINCFLMVHDYKNLSTVVEFLPNCQVVKLINDSSINALSQNFKNNKNKTAVVDLSRITLPKSSIDFDIGSIFDKTQFFNNIDQLLIELDIEDTFLDNNVNQYYQSYCNLYQ